ncbi:hypothetical protein A5645_11060 [Mycobacterium asiaticum]|nr:hypothetical protein A5645_11060 [Mycobacterium asiaticum]
MLVFYRADRIVRRLFDLADLSPVVPGPCGHAGIGHGIVFRPLYRFGDIIALLVATVAEME